MNSSISEKILQISGRPKRFNGTIRLPASKSYLHRALFVSALAFGTSTLTNCGNEVNDDIQASLSALIALGVKITKSKSQGGSFHVSSGTSKSSEITLNAGGSGTTARFLIPFSTLTPPGTRVKIFGNKSLSNRPMESIFQPLAKLGVKVTPLGEEGKLPLQIEGGGIHGGSCVVDGSVSSQFVSSLMISCTKANSDTTISIENPEKQVSSPYIEATIRVLRDFGLKIRTTKFSGGKYSSFKISGGQIVPGNKFVVPGDMSSAAAIIGAAIAAEGQVRLTNAGRKQFPQPDSVIVRVARMFGAEVHEENGNISVVYKKQNRTNKEIQLDFKTSPDLVPAVAGIAAATGSKVSISNIEHLRFKESDRIAVLCRELMKIGIEAEWDGSALRVSASHPKMSKEDVILISPEGDHRMLMALTIAGLSGRFGTIKIEEPDCVRKSYPSFIADLQKLCHEKSTVRIVNSKIVEALEA